MWARNVFYTSLAASGAPEYVATAGGRFVTRSDLVISKKYRKDRLRSAKRRTPLNIVNAGNSGLRSFASSKNRPVSQIKV